MTRESAMLILRGDTDAREWSIETELVIGRDPDCDVQLADRQVSRRHAVVLPKNGGYAVRDAGSKNGLWLNGAPVEGEEPLRDGDELSIAARFKLYFVDAEATAPLLFEETGLRIDRDSMTVFVDGQPLDPPLSGPQYELLHILYRAGGAMVSRDEIIQEVWPDEDTEGVSEDALDALVRRLRMRLDEAAPGQQYVLTVRGYGFRLGPPE